jgi:hypothetical protein
MNSESVFFLQFDLPYFVEVSKGFKLPVDVGCLCDKAVVTAALFKDTNNWTSAGLWKALLN